MDSMDMEVFDCGRPVGKLHLERSGLYQTVDCACRPDSQGILRVFVWRGTEGACLGVLCPEGTDFTLHKRVSKAGLPFAPEQAVVGCEDDGFWPWRGEFDGVWIEDGYLQTGPEGERVALPADGKESMLFSHWQPGESRVICGRDCVVLQPKPAEQPSAPPAPKPQPPAPAPEPPKPAIPQPQPPEKVPQSQEEPQTRFHSEE